MAVEIKLKDLRYLVAVADTRHFGQAAARCFVSQPTLSAQLKKLETSLGVQLIERQPRRVSLTETGQAIVQRARRILEASDEIVTLAQSRSDPLAGRLRVAMLPTIGPYLLPIVAPRLRKALPRLELLLYEYQTVPMLEKLHAGEVDVGILALPVDLDGLTERKLYDEAFVVAVPSAHRLAKRERVKPRSSTAKRCCCSRTATACATRRWRYAAAAACTSTRTFAPRRSKRCARWWRRAAASRCCPSSRRVAPTRWRAASASCRSPNPRRTGTSARCGGGARRGSTPSKASAR